MPYNRPKKKAARPAAGAVPPATPMSLRDRVAALEAYVSSVEGALSLQEEEIAALRDEVGL
jgi:hypothetical protein